MKAEGYASCFRHQVLPDDVENTLTGASVSIFIEDRRGEILSAGTGTIVQNSSDAGNPHNRILTAFHVVDMPVGTSIVVNGSDGAELGTAVLTARGQPVKDY